MRFLGWSVGVILFLALVNAVATWFGLDVASAGESEQDTEQGHPGATVTATTSHSAPH